MPCMKLLPGLFTINRNNRGESGLEGEGDTIRVPALPLADYLSERDIHQINAEKAVDNIFRVYYPSKKLANQAKISFHSL